MRRWKISLNRDGNLPGWLVLPFVQAVGTDELARGWLEALQRLVAPGHCTVFSVNDRGGASVISAASLYGTAAFQTAQAYIRQGFDRQDSNMAWLATRRRPPSAQAWMSHQSADEVADPVYRRLCYGENSIRERVSVLLLMESGQRVAVSFYRNLAFEPFGQADIEWMARLAPLIHTCLKVHLRLPRVHPAGPELRDRMLVALPRREREVIGHLLSGLTMRETASRMGIGLPTVQTHRYRALAKLGVRSQRGLLAQLISKPPDRC